MRSSGNRNREKNFRPVNETHFYIDSTCIDSTISRADAVVVVIAIASPLWLPLPVVGFYCAVFACAELDFTHHSALLLGSIAHSSEIPCS